MRCINTSGIWIFGNFIKFHHVPSGSRRREEPIPCPLHLRLIYPITVLAQKVKLYPVNQSTNFIHGHFILDVSICTYQEEEWTTGIPPMKLKWKIAVSFGFKLKSSVKWYHPKEKTPCIEHMVVIITTPPPLCSPSNLLLNKPNSTYLAPLLPVYLFGYAIFL